MARRDWKKVDFLMYRDSWELMQHFCKKQRIRPSTFLRESVDKSLVELVREESEQESL